MLGALRYFWKEQKLALSVFLLALLLLLWFGARFVLNVIYFNDPAHRNQALELWMTPKYVGMSYKLPPHVIDAAMGLEKQEGRRVRLDRVISDLDITLEELEIRVRAAKEAFEEARAQEREARRAEHEGEKDREDPKRP